jgi:flagellar hook-associated protein 3 FlgL
MANVVSGNLFKNTEQLLKIENMVSSGKQINKPSDDPIGVGKVLDYRKAISSIDQYARNISHAKSWLGFTDSALENVNTLLIEAKGVASSQATGTATSESRLAAAEQIQGIYDEILRLANSKMGNRHIFSGQTTDTAAFAADGAYQGDNGEIRVITGENIAVKININGQSAFQGSVGIFDSLSQLKTALETNDSDGIADQIEPLENALKQILNSRGQVGARLNRLESTENYWNNFKLRIEEMMSETEDVDIARAMTDLVTQQTAYQASLQSASLIFQTSLTSFLG